MSAAPERPEPKSRRGYAGSWTALLVQVMPDDGAWRPRSEIIAALREQRPDKAWDQQAPDSPKSGSVVSRRLSETIRGLARAGLIEREGLEDAQQLRWAPGATRKLPATITAKATVARSDGPWEASLAAVMGGDRKWRLRPETAKTAAALAVAELKRSGQPADFGPALARMDELIAALVTSGQMQARGDGQGMVVRLASPAAGGGRPGPGRRIPPPPIQTWIDPVFEPGKGWVEKRRAPAARRPPT